MPRQKPMEPTKENLEALLAKIEAERWRLEDKQKIDKGDINAFHDLLIDAETMIDALFTGEEAILQKSQLAGSYCTLRDGYLRIGERRDVEDIMRYLTKISPPPHNAHALEDLAAHLLATYGALEAAPTFNRFTHEHLAFEADSTAMFILRHALENPELAHFINPELFKACILQLARHAKRSGNKYAITMEEGIHPLERDA